MKHLVGKKLTKKVPFMGEEVEVKMLTIDSVIEVQKLVAKASKAKDVEAGQIDLMRQVLRLAVVGAEEMTDEEFNGFPIAELTSLSEAVLAVSGIGEGATAVGN